MRSKLTRQLQLVVLSVAFILGSPLHANPIIPIPTQPQPPSFTPSAPNLDATGYILLDAMSGKILAEKEADKRIPPASLTKLMSLYVISTALKNGQIKWEDKVRVSTKAWKTEGSRMFIKAGDEVPVKLLVEGIVVASGNDATVALAEHIAGTEEAFTAIMNEEARYLGMNDTHFVDSTGLPNPEHYSTPRDLAKLTQAYIKNFPEDYRMYSEKFFTYNNIKQSNRNRLLWRYQYADGLKTGHTNEAGYCLVASAKKDGMRLISIVMGEPTDNARNEDSIRLLTYGFRFFETHKLYDAGKSIQEVRVWKGEKTKTPVGVTEDLFVTVPTGQYKHIQLAYELKSPMKAPIKKGDTLGNVKVMLNNTEIASKPIIAFDNNPQGSLWRRSIDAVKYTVHKYFSRSDEKVNTG